MFTGLIADLGTLTQLRRDPHGATLQVSSALAGEIAPGDSVAVNGVCLTASTCGPEGFSAAAMLETLRRTTLGDLEAGAPLNLELPLRADGRLGGHIVQGHVDGVGIVREIVSDGFARVLRIELPADGAAGGGDRIGGDGRAGGESGVGGEAGEAGVRGETGEAGVRGETGVGGEAGEAGVRGETGEAGVRGETGEAGVSDLARYLVQKGSVALDGVSLTVSDLDAEGFSVSLIPETLARTNLGTATAGRRVNLEVDILAKHLERLIR